jgi:hypothetical protein
MRRERADTHLDIDVTIAVGTPGRLYGREHERDLFGRLPELGQGSKSLVVRGDADIGRLRAASSTALQVNGGRASRGRCSRSSLRPVAGT